MDCATYNGFDLLGDNASGMEDSEVTLFIVRSAGSDYRYSSHEAVTIRWGSDIVESLHVALTGEDPRSS